MIKIMITTTIINNDFDYDYDYYYGYGYDYDYGDDYDYDYDNEKMGVGRIRTFSFSSDSSHDPCVYDQVQIVGDGSRSGRIHQSQCSFPRFGIGLVLPLLSATSNT